MEIAFNIGAATFGRTKTNNTGFAMFQKSGILQGFGNDELTVAFQLPSEVELFENTDAFSIIRAKTTQTREELVAISAYRYSGIDRDNRKTYYAASFCYSNKGFCPSPQSIIALLNELLAVSNNQQSYGIEKADIQLKPVLSIPAATTSINEQIIKDSYFIVIENEKKQTVEEFISIAHNKKYSKYQKLFFSTNEEVIKATTLEKLSINFETLNTELLAEYQKNQEGIKDEYETLSKKYSLVSEEKDRLQLKLSQIEVETKQLLNEKKYFQDKIQILENTVHNYREQLIQKDETKEGYLMRKIKKIKVSPKFLYLFFILAAACSSFIIFQLNLRREEKLILASIPYFIILFIFLISNKDKGQRH